MADIRCYMLESLRQRSIDEPTEQSPTTDQPNSKAASETTAFRIGRLTYGGILTMMAVNGLQNAEESAQYAEAKNIPMPKFATIISHVLLLVGGVGISLWRAPALAASAVATFFLGVTPAMHDFWAVDDPEQKQQQMTHFLKNAALLGTALLLLGLAEAEE